MMIVLEAAALISHMQGATRAAARATVGEITLTVVEAGIVIVGRHSSLSGEKRQLATWANIRGGDLVPAVEHVANILRRHVTG